MKKVIVLSRVSTEGQDLTQQTDEVLREVYKDGYTDSNIIIIEDKESAIQLSEEERHGLNKMKEYISTNPNINCVYIYELSRLSRIPLVLYSIRDYLVERRIQLICLKPYFSTIRGRRYNVSDRVINVLSLLLTRRVRDDIKEGENDER